MKKSPTFWETLKYNEKIVGISPFNHKTRDSHSHCPSLPGIPYEERYLLTRYLEDFGKLGYQ